jgi:hypothetical protein
LLCNQVEPPSKRPGTWSTASLDWLQHRAQFCSAPWSLAWAFLALTAFERATHTLINRLASVLESDAIDDSATLAVASLALNSVNGLNAFGANS